MNLIYLIVSYMVFTEISIGFQIGETIHHERVYINDGGSPLGDSTYLSYLSIMFFRLLAGAIGIVIGSVWQIKIPQNIWWFLLATIGLYFIFTLVGATAQAIVSVFAIRHENNKWQRRMIDSALKSKADTVKGTDKQ